MKKKLYILVLAYLAICALMSAIKGSVAIAMFGLLVFLLTLIPQHILLEINLKY